MPRDSTTLHVGSIAPDFQLETASGERYALHQALTSPLALVFIRGSW
jgi:peroxiredoxin